MNITAEERVSYFETELEMIFDKKVREFTKLCLVQAPDYIFTNCPSSSSGKYHPIEELAPDGTLIHMKKIVAMAYTMVRAFDCENNRDLVLSACLIHDLRKQGKTSYGHTVKDHPNHAAELVVEIQEATKLLTDYQFNIIKNCVGYHYGPWGVDQWYKEVKDFTPEELSVFISDYVVSKRFIHTDYEG